MAPEIKFRDTAKQPYHAGHADMFSLGVCLFAILYDELPIINDEDDHFHHLEKERDFDKKLIERGFGKLVEHLKRVIFYCWFKYNYNNEPRRVTLSRLLKDFPEQGLIPEELQEELSVYLRQHFA